jgi:hypothetical protein
MKDRVKACVITNGKQPDQPRKWHKHLPKVPAYIPCSTEVDETIWVLIHYEGAHATHSFTRKQTNCCVEGFATPVGIQRAIKIDLQYDKGVKWHLYQNTASTIKHKDVKTGIRTFKKV